MKVLAQVLGQSEAVFSSRFQKRFPALAAMVIGRNVANVPEVETFLKSFHTDNEEINRWVDTALRKWMIRDFDKTKPYAPKAEDPAWMQGKQDLVMVEVSNDLQSRIEHVIDFLKAQAAANPNLKLNNFQATEAFKQAGEWMEKLMKKKVEEEVEGKDFEVLLEDGPYKWCKLISENALAREGRLMGHCVGGYWTRVKAGDVEIYSMRDQKNEPHVTIEFIPKGRRVDQIKGKQNKSLKDEYRPTLINFLNSRKMPWKKINQYDANMNGILLGGGGTVIDKENIPDGSTLQGPIKDYEGEINFPANVKILGDFVASKKQSSLPSKRFEVTGNCDLSARGRGRYGDAGGIPEELLVRKNFMGSGNLIEALPKKFLIGGDVFLDGCNLLSLPNNLKIKGEFDISNNPISKLPQNLQVAGEFDLMETNISELPAGLQCGDSIYVDDGFDVESVPEHLKDLVFA